MRILHFERASAPAAEIEQLFIPSAGRYRLICQKDGRRIATALAHVTPFGLVRLAKRLNQRFPSRYYYVEPEATK